MEGTIKTANINKLLQANNMSLCKEPLISLFNETQLDYEMWKKILDPTILLSDNLE